LVQMWPSISSCKHLIDKPHSSTSMQFLWGMINLMQLITFQSLMSIKIPALPRSINNVILEFSQMDLLPSEQIVE
jgi:hypothetical protein